MLYLLFKNDWVEHTPDYLLPENDRPRLEATVAAGHAQNIKNARFHKIDGKPVVMAADLMSSNVLHVSLKTPLIACHHIMKTEGVHHLAVFEDGKFCGLISDRDVLIFAKSELAKKATAADIITTVVLAAHESTTIGRTAKVFLQEGINAMPVLDDELAIVGIITTKDILRFMTSIIA